MIEVNGSNIDNQTATNRLICEGALARGWTVMVPYLPSPHIIVDRGDHRELHLFSAVPPTTSYAAAHLVDDKYATYKILEHANVAQLATIQFSEYDNFGKALDFLKLHNKIVIKPVDGGHGHGITVNIRSEGQLHEGIARARASNRRLNSVILQKQFMADPIHDVRIVVIGGQYVAAIDRIPARVRGDGVHNIEELISLTNLSSDRGEPYRAKLARINIEHARTYLQDRIHIIPDEGQYYTVLGVANYGAGGELMDVTDMIPEWMRQEAVHVAEILGLSVAGVDYMVDGVVDKSQKRDELKAVIAEVNKSPSLAIHDEPTYGINRKAVEKYLDFIASL